ncbi:hypothetical protein JG688_00000396 [Phytophthora aleatoria]|uniref:DUF7769 domain-containing protein n=1 Tax=Phytophthora aleatoria TaxID=2496075 RepID=A0A8J5MJ59_9STRA|nr:hypothetical protein JG688_00000396 [Phytophthora aleatoria]
MSDPSVHLTDTELPDNASYPPELRQDDKRRHKPNLTDDQRLMMADFLLKHSQGEARLPRSVITAAADKFEVHRNTVSRIWNLMKAAMDVGAPTDVVMNQVLSKKRGNCGRKKKDYSAALELVKQLPLSQRGSLRALSSAVGVPRTTLFRLLRNEDSAGNPVNTPDDQQDSSSDAKPKIANAIKPALSDKNKRERLKLCLDKMQPNGVFDDMKEIQTMVTNYVIPAIKTKMPSSLRNGPLFIQLDNQQMRLTPDDPVVAEVGRADGWDIQVQYQPAYSPELVVLNHTFLKSIYPEMTARRVNVLPPMEELIAGVERAFAAIPSRQINDAFLSLQKTMECIMLAGGSNDFESQEDATKQSLQRDGSLPVSVLCKREALLACQAILNAPPEATAPSSD